METRANYALIGAFVIIAALAALGFVLWLGQSQFNRDYDVYDAVFEGPVTLEEGASVRYIGIKVGEVSWVRIDREDASKVRARIRVDSETPVKTDSTASIQLAGITGVTFIQIRPGSPSAQRLPVRMGENLPVIDTERTQLEEIFEGGQDLMANAQVTITRLNSLLNSENTETFSEILNNIEALTGTLANDEDLVAGVTRALEALADAGDAVGDAADSFNQVGSNVQVSLDDITKDVQALIADAREAVKTAEQAIVETQDGVMTTIDSIQAPTAKTFEEINRLSSEMRLLVRRLDNLAREIEQNPQSFIQGQPKPYREPTK